MNLLFMSILLIACSFYSQDDKNISHWRGPDRNGIYPDKGLLKKWPENGPELSWEFNQLGMGFSSPAFANDKVYITGTTDSITYLFALNHEGELLWKTELGKEYMGNYPGARSTPKIIYDKGYVLNGLAILTCFDATNGSKIWEMDFMKKYNAKKINFGLSENLLIDDDVLYCTPGGNETTIIAIDRFNGELIWESKVDGEGSGYCSPVLFQHNGDKYLATITEKSLVALNVNNGNIVWKFSMPGNHGIHANSPIYHNGRIFVMCGWELGSFQLRIAEDGQTVEQAWKSEILDLENGDAILIGNNLYAANWKQKGFSCVDWETGVEKFKNSDLISGSIAYADGLFYWYGVDGDVALIKSSDNALEIISQFRVPGLPRRDHSAHPVIHDKKLYLRHGPTLWAYDISL